MDNNNKKTPANGLLIFGIVWTGQLASTLGSGLTSFALGVWVYEQTGSPTLFAVNILLWTLPMILFSPIAGAIADRHDRRWVMIAADTGAGLSTVFVAVMFFSGHLEVWHVYLATFFNSAFSSFQWPAYAATTSLLVPKKHLGRASGMTQASDAIGHLITPALAGLLYVRAGMDTIFILDILSYVIALGTLLAVRFPRPKATQDEDENKSFWQQAWYGWTYIRQRPGLLGLLCIFAGMNFLISLTFPLLTPMLLDMSSPEVLGFVNSATGLGMLGGTLLLSVWGGPKRRIFGIFGGEFLSGFFLLLHGVQPSIPLIAFAGFGMMLSMPLSNGGSQAIWQSKVAADVQGRVFAIRRMIAFSIEPIAIALAGPVAERIFEPQMAADGRLAAIFGPLFGVGPGRGIGLMFVFSGILYMLLATGVLLYPRTRRVELELPDAVAAEEETEAEPV